MRRSLTLAYGGLAALIVLCVVVQVFLAGLGIFGAKTFNPHKDFGGIVHGLTLLTFLLAIAGPRNWTDVGLGFGLAVLCTIQISLADTSIQEDAPGVAALHPVLALGVLFLALYIAWRVLGRRAGEAAPPPVATAAP